MTCLYGPVRCAERYVKYGVAVAGLTTGGPFCATDHVKIKDMLRDLPYLRLELALARSQPVQGDGGTTRVHPPLPIREDVDAIERELDRVVFSWSEAIEAELRLSPTYRFGPAARRLLVHLGTLYQLGPTPMTRWVNADQVAGLPDHTIGTVRSSGEAIVIQEITGGQGAIELHRLHHKGCTMIRREH